MKPHIHRNSVTVREPSTRGPRVISNQRSDSGARSGHLQRPTRARRMGAAIGPRAARGRGALWVAWSVVSCVTIPPPPWRFGGIMARRVWKGGWGMCRARVGSVKGRAPAQIDAAPGRAEPKRRARSISFAAGFVAPRARGRGAAGRPGRRAGKLSCVPASLAAHSVGQNRLGSSWQKRRAVRRPVCWFHWAGNLYGSAMAHVRPRPRPTLPPGQRAAPAACPAAGWAPACAAPCVYSVARRPLCRPSRPWLAWLAWHGWRRAGRCAFQPART
ncbi:unnamed protein product [Amoebophrya sp. A120]|nr:unnamed protein product [Amoebophrya sp. A120]|eukprot:GSA120T00022419001.1